MDIREIFDRNQARVGRGAILGPLALAIAHLNVVVAEGKKRQVESETFKAIEILLDTVHKHREALQAAGEFALNLVDSSGYQVAAGNEEVPSRKKKLMAAAFACERKLPDLIEDFKKKSLLAKMDQEVPPSDMRLEGKEPGHA